MESSKIKVADNRESIAGQYVSYIINVLYENKLEQ